MGKAPAFQFYANDFMDATRMWDAFACGLYIRLLCIQWTHGSVPDDQRRLAKGAGCDLSELQREWHLIEPKFPICSDGTRKNPRLEAVRSRQEAVSGKRSEAANTRWKGNANADATGHAKRKQRKVKVEGEIEREDGSMKAEVEPTFDQWFDLYDKRRDRAGCVERWSKLDQSTREAIMRHTRSYVAAQPDKTYRKDPIRYLSKRGWEDEIVTTKQNGQARTEDDYLAKRRAIIEANAKFYRERDAFEGGGTGGVPGAQNDPGAR